MSYVILGGLAAIVALVITLAIAIKVAKTRYLLLREMEAKLESVRVEYQRRIDYQQKREEAQSHADERKETLHTGDSTTDFDNSLNMLHSAGKNRER